MSDFTALMDALHEVRKVQVEQNVVLDYVKKTGEETRADLKSSREETREDLKKLTSRIGDLETKASMMRGVWLAVVGASTLVGIIGVMVAVVANLAKLTGH